MRHINWKPGVELVSNGFTDGTPTRYEWTILVDMHGAPIEEDKPYQFPWSVMAGKRVLMQDASLAECIAFCEQNEPIAGVGQI